MLTVVGANIV